jgi:hypothetical protein
VSDIPFVIFAGTRLEVVTFGEATILIISYTVSISYKMKFTVKTNQ